MLRATVRKILLQQYLPETEVTNGTSRKRGFPRPILVHLKASVGFPQRTTYRWRWELMRPLEGVRVVDFTTLLPGPLATLLLLESGAEVIKVERPGRGEEMRRHGPMWGQDS